MIRLLQYTLFALFLIANSLSGQGIGVNSSGNAPHASAGLDVDFNDRGILIPRLTSAERNGILQPAPGLMILNIDNFCLEMWDGMSWRSACFDCGYNGQVLGGTNLCVGDSLLLYVNLLPGSQSVWTLPSGQSITGDSIQISGVTPSDGGVYMVQVTAPGCVVPPAQVNVQVAALPGGLQPTVNNPVLVGSQIQLQAANIPGATYMWTGPNGFTSTQQNPVISNAQLSESGYYVVRVQLGTCTSAPDSVSVTVMQQVSQLFSQSGTFVVPQGVGQVRVLCVGGGGGGGNGHSGGGGAGYVSTGTFTVNSGQSIAVTVGGGGTGAIEQNGSNTVAGISPGGSSSFGGLLSAGGGQVVTSSGSSANAGGSGGGGSCNAGTNGGNGGTGGSNGGSCSNSGGQGQGNYVPSLSLFIHSTVSAGAGGQGGSSSHAGGGGGGGVLINANGPAGANGPKVWSGKGGNGYGGGGGAGGYDSSTSIREAGGNGASGVVYVEWF